MMDSAPAEMFEGGDEAQFAEAFIKNMQFLADKAQKVGVSTKRVTFFLYTQACIEICFVVQEAKSEDEFANAMQSLSNDETYESEFMPFMQGLMGCILSKEVLYPSLKEMCEKVRKLHLNIFFRLILSLYVNVANYFFSIRFGWKSINPH